MKWPEILTKLTNHSLIISLPAIDFSQWQKAAVLVPIILHPQMPTILLTRRQDHLAHHPGQISFPGGRNIVSDVDLTATALRETEEEIGIAAQHINIITTLPARPTLSSNHFVTPIIASIDPTSTREINHAEVAEIIELPLSHLFEKTAFIPIPIKFQQYRFTNYQLTYQQHIIWGFTAIVLHDLAEILLR